MNINRRICSVRTRQYSERSIPLAIYNANRKIPYPRKPDQARVAINPMAIPAKSQMR